MIVTLDSMIEGVNIDGLPTIEEISQGYKSDMVIANGEDNPKTFTWKFLNTDYLMESAKFWKDQILVDLGCGIWLDGYGISKIAGAKSYVAVDPFNLTRFYKRLVDTEETKGDDKFNDIVRKAREFIQIQDYDEKTVERIISNMDSYFEGKYLDISLVAEDMVTALRRFPDDSVSVLTAGLDNCIIWRDEYAELAEEEITRVLHPQGAYLAICSRLKPKNLNQDSSFNNDNSFNKFTK